MTQDEINEWNKTNLLHMMNLKWVMDAEYEKARKASEQVWDDPNAHVGGPIWVGKTKVTTVGLKDNKRYKTRQLNNFYG